MFFMFAEWLVESKRKPDAKFEHLSPEELAPLLKDFFYGVRTKKNTRYSKSAYKSIRAGLQRHLESKPYYQKFTIAKDAAFKEANQVFSGYLAKLKKDGLDRTKHKRTILPGDVAKLYREVFTDTPQGLQ